MLWKAHVVPPEQVVVHTVECLCIINLDVQGYVAFFASFHDLSDVRDLFLSGNRPVRR